MAGATASTSGAATKRAFLAVLAGGAFWWPCVFQGDYGMVRAALGDDALPITQFLLPFALLVFSVSFGASGRLRSASGSFPPLGYGICGSAGYLLLTVVGLSSVGVLPAALLDGALADALACVGAAASAVFLIGFLYRLLAVGARLPKGCLAGVLAGSYAITEAFQLALFFLPEELRLVYRVLCPLVSGVVLAEAERAGVERALAGHRGDGPLACVWCRMLPWSRGSWGSTRFSRMPSSLRRKAAARFSPCSCREPRLS